MKHKKHCSFREKIWAHHIGYCINSIPISENEANGHLEN